MNRQTQTCLCCNSPLLRHIRHGKIYWFCSHCRQEAPIIALEQVLIETNMSKAIATSESSVI
jgi:ribosomal protein L37AE/L43A